MAIKPISRLDQFDNQTATSQGNIMAIGKSIALFSGNLLTENDKNCVMAPGHPDSFVPSTNEYGYWSMLFEVSQPDSPDKGLAQINKFYSKKLTYEDLIKNILWDVKGFLNYRNNLNDYDLSGVIDGDWTFAGNKTFSGNLSVQHNITAENVYAKNISSNNLSADNSIINNLSVMQSLYINCDISTADNFFDGYAYGLKDKDKNLTNRGTYTSTKDVQVYGIEGGQTLSGKPNRSGDPVCFLSGRPYELTCVNNAINAYKLIGQDGEKMTVGDVTHPVWIHEGVPISTDTIEIAKVAHKAYWADLGERYLADECYEPGTLVKFGGEYEITLADSEANAVVSKAPFELNCNLENGIPIALCGRTPIKIIGKISKFDKVTLSETPGVGRKAESGEPVIGIALSASDMVEVKLVECVTKFKF